MRCFGGRSSLEDVYAKIAGSDALVHPAVHEAFGQACLEALVLGVPVICLDWAGPGIIVNDASGLKVVPGDREETIGRLGDAMKRLAGGSTRPSAESCVERALEEFSWAKLADEISKKYREILPDSLEGGEEATGETS